MSRVQLADQPGKNIDVWTLHTKFLTFFFFFFFFLPTMLIGIINYHFITLSLNLTFALSQGQHKAKLLGFIFLHTSQKSRVET